MIFVCLLLCSALACGEWVSMDVEATAYCSGPCCCGPRARGVTADGTEVSDYPYGVAVDPRVIAYGTPVWIPLGYGYLDNQQPDDRVFYADDTGGIIRRRTRATGRVHVDLRFRRHSSAVRYGVRTITIYVWRD